MTSGMIEDYGINRKTFTDNIDSLVEENLVWRLAEKHGKQNWRYYKTTILGKVLFLKPTTVVREEDGKMTIVDIPSVATYFGETDDGEKYRMATLAFFYNYLERLKKFDLHEAQIQDTGVVWDLEIPSNVLYDQLPDAMFDAFSFIDITKLDKNRELTTFWGHEGHYQDPEYGVSIMVPILPEAGFTPMSTIEPMTEMEMRYQREEREEKFPEPGPLGEKGWFVNISAYFRLDEWNPKTGECEEEMVIKTRTKMFDFIEDVLTFNFLVNLKTITGNLKAASPATKKLFKDPDLNKFYNNMLNELVERSGSLDSYLKKYKI